MAKSVGEFLTRQDAAAFLGLSDFWLEKHARTGKGPRYFRHGRLVYYPKHELELWQKTPQAQLVQGRGPGGMPSDDELEASYELQHGHPPTEAHAAQRFMQSLNADQKALLAQYLHTLQPSA